VQKRAGRQLAATVNPPVRSIKPAISATPRPGAKIGEQEGALAPHLARVAVHDFEACADHGRKVDLVDDRGRTRDPRPAFARDLVAAETSMT